MQAKFICKNCGKEKQANPRLKSNQRYCNEQACQRARKAEWHKRKMATDSIDTSKQLNSSKASLNYNETYIYGNSQKTFDPSLANERHLLCIYLYQQVKITARKAPDEFH